MAISKQYLKTKPVCKVTFTVPASDANKVSVIGDFNAWDPKKASLKKLKNGKFKGTLDLPVEQSYEFRYLIDGATYVNDEEADDFRWNDYAGTENAVLSI